MSKNEKAPFDYGELIYKVKKVISQYFELPTLGEDSPTRANAAAMLDRCKMTGLMPYRGYDQETGLVVGDDGDVPWLGLGIEFKPLIMGGKDTEDIMETMIRKSPKDTVIQVGIHSSPDIRHQMESWLKKRRSLTEKKPILREMSERRARFFIDGANDYSMTKKEGRQYARHNRGYIFFRFPFSGELRDPDSVQKWITSTLETKQFILGTMQGAGIGCQVINQYGHRRLLMQLLNPQYSPDQLDKLAGGYDGFPKNLIRKDTRQHVTSEGTILFDGGGKSKEAVVVTVDGYPEYLTINKTRLLTGDVLARDERIADPYWIWTAIHVCDKEDARDSLTKNLGVMSKLTLSESAWFRSMAGPLYRRKAETEALLAITEKEYGFCRMATGIVVYAEAGKGKQVADAVSALWSKHGFQASPERYITLPMFISSMPYCYDQKNDSPNNGLQRMELVNTYNAACALPLASDWTGQDLSGGGAPFVTRRGQIASINFMETPTNMNVAVAAVSGAGKSVFGNEIMCDYLSRNGIVRAIDVGRSYAPLAEVLDGQNMVFDPASPVSINPFYGMKNREDFDDQLPLLQSTVELMAFPKSEATSWEFQAIEKMIDLAWTKHGEELELSHVYQAFRESTENVQDCNRIADQLESYAIGRLSPWFNGPPTVSFTNDFSILELEELNSDPKFRTVVLALVINMIMKDIYQSLKREKGGLRPKLLLIDEAWDLMAPSAGNAARFIETAARRIRKYGGTLMTITQSFKDYLMSPSAQAAFDNSAWRCALQQAPESLNVARDKNMFEGGQFTYDLMTSVKSSPHQEFSEIQVMNPSGGTDVFRLVLDSFSYYVYSTKADDKNALANLMQRGMSRLEATKHLADQRDQALGRTRYSVFDAEAANEEAALAA